MPKIEVILKAKYKTSRYEFSYTVGEAQPNFWQSSNILEVPNNGRYTVWYRNILTGKTSKQAAIVNCQDGENVCTIVVESLMKGVFCAVTVEKLLKLEKPIEQPYLFAISGIQRVGSTGCRYELQLDEPSNHRNTKTFHVKLINEENGTVIKERDVILDTSVYNRIGSTLTDDGITTPGVYRFEISLTYEGKTYGDSLSEEFTADELCASNPCAGKSDAPEWSVTGTPYCDEGDLKVARTQINPCCFEPIAGTIEVITLQENAGECSGEGGGEGEPTNPAEQPDPNPNVEMIIDHLAIKGRFKNVGSSGTYTGVAKFGNLVLKTVSGLVYSQYIEMTIDRFINGVDYSGKAIVWEFTRQGHSFSIEFFTPKMVIDGHEPDYNNLNDTVLLLRFKKPFNSGRIIHEDYGNNLGLIPFYETNDSIYHDENDVPNSRILSPEPVPAKRWIEVVKFCIDPAITNINVDGWKMYYANPQAGKFGANLNFWYQTAANQIL